MIVTAYIPFLHSVEFYVILTVVATAVIALFARPSERGAAQTHLLAGTLCDGDTHDDDSSPRLYIECLENGNVLIRRTDVTGVGADGALSLVVDVRGLDLNISERLTRGRTTADSTSTTTDAVFILDFMVPDWYHIHYTCDPTDRYAAFSLHVRPGIKQIVRLRQ